ncbi:MAG: PepSY domain-containing protein [Caldilineaceae bacterium]|nr:PepSY domain-containing protein [Caldilineaceae bacterium]
MLKQMKNKVYLSAAAAGLLLGGLGTTAFIGHAQTTNPPAPAPAVQQQQEDGDTTQDPSYTGSILVDEKATDGMSEADEAAALQGQAKITAAEAEAAALAANPGTKVVKSELDNENGVLVYSVELDNGMDVKVDAGNAAVLYTDQDDDGSEVDEADESENEQAEANDTDDVQDEHEDGDQDDAQEESAGQPDDATEVPGTEDAAGK